MKKTKHFLIALNLIWSLAALIYDWPIIITLPWYSWPFIVICPLYPFLLALAWGLLPPDRQLPERGARFYLIAFAALASAVWGLLALIFYPLTMLVTGWSGNAFGQIIWVWVYAVQGWWMYLNLPLPKKGIRFAGALMILILTVEYQTKTLGYLDVAALTPGTWFLVYLTGLVSVVVLVSCYQKRLFRFAARNQLQ